MKRGKPLQRRTPLRAKQPQRPAFAVEKNDVFLFFVGAAWLMGSVVRKTRDKVLMETAALVQHWIPLDARRLRLPDPGQVGSYQIEGEQARHAREMSLPPLSGAVVVRLGGTPRTVGPRRRKRYRKSAYRAFVRTLPPLDGGAGKREAHHVNDRDLGGDRGVGQVDDDYNCVCLSRAAHRHLTDHHVLPGRTKAETREILLLGLAETRKAWMVLHEEGDVPQGAAPIEGDDADARYLRALPKLAALAAALLVLLLSDLTHAAPLPAVVLLDLHRGRAALAETPPQPTYAYRLCRRAAEVKGPHRAEALTCQGRAALLIGWAPEAMRLAFAARREPHYPVAALVLLGDALRQQGRCAEARTAYLDALKSQEDEPAATEGLRACGGDPPPRPVAQAGGPS